MNTCTYLFYLLVVNVICHFFILYNLKKIYKKNLIGCDVILRDYIHPCCNEIECCQYVYRNYTCKCACMNKKILFKQIIFQLRFMVCNFVDTKFIHVVTVYKTHVVLLYLKYKTRSFTGEKVKVGQFKIQACNLIILHLIIVLLASNIFKPTITICQRDIKMPKSNNCKAIHQRSIAVFFRDDEKYELFGSVRVSKQDSNVKCSIRKISFDNLMNNHEKSINKCKIYKTVHHIYFKHIKNCRHELNSGFICQMSKYQKTIDKQHLVLFIDMGFSKIEINKNKHATSIYMSVLLCFEEKFLYFIYSYYMYVNMTIFTDRNLIMMKIYVKCVSCIKPRIKIIKLFKYCATCSI